jgi:hypothetical protein
MAEAADRIAHVKDQVLDEHRRVRDITKRMGDARDLRDLLERLREARGLVVTHFSSEEAPGGFYDLLRGAAPSYLGRIDQMQREHQAMLGDLDRLLERAQACLDGPIAEIFQDVADLARRLQRHEARENEVLLDSMYTDLGQGE